MLDLNNIAKEVFEIESKEIANLSSLLTDDFKNAVNEIVQCNGKFIICGMGKSGLMVKR